MKQGNSKRTLTNEQNGKSVKNLSIQKNKKQQKTNTTQA